MIGNFKKTGDASERHQQAQGRDGEAGGLSRWSGNEMRMVDGSVPV